MGSIHQGKILSSNSQGFHQEKKFIMYYSIIVFIMSAMPYLLNIFIITAAGLLVTKLMKLMKLFSPCCK